MWNFQAQKFNQQTVKFTLNGPSGVISFRSVLKLWSEQAEFRAFFTTLLVGSEFAAFFWETPAITAATRDQPFEFVLVNAPEFSQVKADVAPFQFQFAAQPNKTMLAFPNLGGDAVLVVPAPIHQLQAYAHLAAFVRQAPAGQVDAFWQCLGNTMQERISSAPIWLSTAGLGVSWLHLRLDSRPKYYRHEPYRHSPVAR